ncbi:enoyl-CoA hydratase/isomerase family protein [Nocardioides albus]|uniref:Enoyl-CoA hydratase/carnithine racemase n=1 Tax=Nocardioides albus TaxID=1841 RepID=A0A7W5F890_9ACTN|nr:enoyl-CoA hydratase/isomerase family protein [Nocardioides albus]MBB3088990.1 enoyl-CoA hydratase/carnithine racemase [Nocardioides albus]GGU14973.1 enoyl-CoA hydratase [Nocardioides albus]
MDYQHIRYETLEPGIAQLTLNRPERMNAYDVVTARECVDALARYASDDEQRVLIVTGEGRGFCSGGDLRSHADEEIASGRMIGHATVMREGFHALTRSMRQLTKPTIAMVNGPAVAGGLTLALLCDLRIASDRATLGDTSGNAGLLPDEGGAWLFPRFLGLEKALRMTYLGEVYDAEEALRLGLVGEVVPHDDLSDHTLALARGIAGRAPLAVRLAKRMMVRGLEETLDASLDHAEIAVTITNDSEDVQEGVKAFLDKREPVFRGR